MEFEEYKKKYFADPPPEQNFKFSGILGATLYYQDYPSALAFFRQVLGEPAYVEGQYTHGWQVGKSWLTVFPSKAGTPTNIEVPIYLKSAKEVDKLYTAFIAAGAEGSSPEDTLMYAPVRMTVVTDPFGVQFTLAAEIPPEA
jgi:uncharacterized glyoxalase superfamily protein PhnB